jgi:hypothetical protein
VLTARLLVVRAWVVRNRVSEPCVGLESIPVRGQRRSQAIGSELCAPAGFGVLDTRVDEAREEEFEGFGCQVQKRVSQVGRKSRHTTGCSQTTMGVA